MKFLIAVSLSMFLQQSGPATTTGPCSVANSGTIDKVNITCVIGKEDGQEKPEIKIREVVLDRDLDTTNLQQGRVYRRHLMQIHFSTGIDWKSNRLSVYIEGGDFPFPRMRLSELSIREQRSPIEADVDIFRVSNFALHSDVGESLIAFCEPAFVIPPDPQYRAFSLEEGAVKTLKIGIALNDVVLKTQDISLRLVRTKFDPNAKQDVWDVVFEKSKE